MAYTGNHRIDAALLVVINDGNGDQCGASYRDRLNLARDNAAPHHWNLMMRRAARHCSADTLVNMTREEMLQGGKFLLQYYRDLIAEGA